MAVKLNPINMRCQRVLPAVYTDEISYYEVLCKLRDKLNEVIEVVGDAATIDALKDAIVQIEAEIDSLKDYVDTQVENAKIYSDMKNDALERRLVDLIYNITVGKIIVRSQTTGKTWGIQNELDKQYDYLRYFSYNAGKEDGFELEADELDSWDATAYEIDLYNTTLYENDNLLHVQKGD